MTARRHVVGARVTAPADDHGWRLRGGVHPDYPGRWAEKTLERLGVPFELHETGGARGAAGKLDAALAAGRPVLATIDRQTLGHWHLPADLEGHGGYPVVVYGAVGDRMRIDDRNLAR